MKRRGFLTACVATVAAPAIVRAESLMRLWVPPRAPLWFGFDLGSTEISGISIMQKFYGEKKSFCFAFHPSAIEDWKKALYGAQRSEAEVAHLESFRTAPLVAGQIGEWTA